jgi:hypothetical protein
MSHSHEDERLSDDLRHVADVLREGRPTLDPLALDRVKLRAMSAARRSSPSRRKGFPMKQRLTTLIAIGLLTLGTGGTLALAGGGDDGGGSASFHQYKPPCDKGKGQGKDHECHGHEGEETGKGGDHGGGPGGGGDKGGGGKDEGKGGGDKGGGDKGGHGHH